MGALSSGTRMATSPMLNTGPIATPHQSAISLSSLPGTTLYTTMPGNHYPNYTMADHEGSVRTPSALDAHYLPSCPWKSHPLVALTYSTGHIDVSESSLCHAVVALQCTQQGGWWEFFTLPKVLCHSLELQNQVTSRIVASNPPQ